MRRMQFIRSDTMQEGSEALATRLKTELAATERVLWLIGGGSSITAVVDVMSSIPEEDTKKLAIFLTDERFGEVGHINSNAKQLHDAGFDPKDAIFVPMLEPGFSIAETQERYSQALERAVEHANIVIAQFGIGPDGHIAGILPHTSAVHATGWTVAYDTPHYSRVSMTFDAIRQVNAAYAFVFGNAKAPALQQLLDESLDLAEQPAQILKELPEAYIYNDQLGDRL